MTTTTAPQSIHTMMEDVFPGETYRLVRRPVGPREVAA